MKTIKKMWLVKVIHNQNKADLYYRKDEALADELYQMNKGLFPGATVTKKLVEVKVEEN